MHTSVRNTIVVVIGVVIALVIFYTLAGFLLTPYLLKRQITGVLSERTGGEVTVGQLSVNPFLLSADLRQLSINSPDHQPFFTLVGVQARLDIASLWRRGWIIPELVLDTPRLWIDALPAVPDRDDPVPVFSIGHLQVRDGQLRWTDTATGVAVPGAIIDLTAIELAVENLGTDPLKPGQFTLAAVVNRSGWVKASGSLKPFPASVDAMVEFSGFNLADLDTLMPAGSDPGEYLEIRSALLSGKLNVLFEPGQTDIHGQARLDQLELVDRSSHAAVFSAANVQATDLAIQSSPFMASVEMLQLNKPHLRLMRDTDRTLRGGHWLTSIFDRPSRPRPAIPRIEIQDGLLELTDQSLTSPYLLKSDRIEGSIIQDDNSTTVSMTGRVMGAGTSVLNAQWLPTGPNGQSSLDISVGNLDATVLSPYLAALTGRGIASGQLDLSFDYQASDQQFELKNEISALGFQLDEVRVSPVAHELLPELSPELPPELPIELPLDLAVALVRDGNDRINIAIPVPSGLADQNMQPGSLVSAGFVNLVQSISSAPFQTLGQLAGVAPRHLERVVFMPGDAALPRAAARKLAILGSALVQRPGLGLKVNGRFDTVADRQVLARKQVSLHVALATSAGPPGRDAPIEIDFDDTKVISVLDEFAGKRLSATGQAALRANHPQRDSAFYAAVFEALVKNEVVSDTALKSLARYRARTIVDQLKATGVDPQRLQIGSEVETAQEHARVVMVELAIVLL